MNNVDEDNHVDEDNINLVTFLLALCTFQSKLINCETKYGIFSETKYGTEYLVGLNSRTKYGIVAQ